MPGSCKSFRLVTLIIWCLAACALCSCKKKEEAAAPAAMRAAAPAGGSEQSTGTATPPEIPRKIIRNYSLTLEVRQFPVALEALTKLTESSGGYVFKSSRNSQDRSAAWGEVGIRVPVNSAGSVLTGIRGLGRVESENSTAEDITEGYVDLAARLKNARASEARLAELYRKASELADVLEVEKELTRVRGDIEAFEARKKSWDLLTEMVTIEVSMSEASGGLPAASRIWAPLRTACGEALVGAADSLHTLIIFLGALMPWLALFGPLAYVVMRWRRTKVLKAGGVPGKDATVPGDNAADQEQ